MTLPVTNDPIAAPTVTSSPRVPVSGVLVNRPVRGGGVPDSPSPRVPRQAYSSIAQCVAAVCLTDGRVTEEMVKRLLRDIKSSTTPDARRTFALLAVAEIGRHVYVRGEREEREWARVVTCLDVIWKELT